MAGIQIEFTSKCVELKADGWADVQQNTNAQNSLNKETDRKCYVLATISNEQKHPISAAKGKSSPHKLK